MFNAKEWGDYLHREPSPMKKLPAVLDARSRIWAKRMIFRRTHDRFCMTPAEAYRYSRCKRLRINYWFPDAGTLLNSVFLFKCGLAFIPPTHLNTIRNRIAVDGGAASGDSSLMLLENGASRILAFEPSPRQRDEMNQVFVKNNCAGRIETVDLALGEHPTTITFSDQYGERVTANVTTIDEHCKNLDIGCIKLDIEGAEYPAIRGAVRTIERCRPILLVCVYHRPEDLFELPAWLHDRFPFYQLRIRDTEPCNCAAGAHLTLIAWPS